VQIGIPTESNCMVREVIPSMSLSLILANISVKTWRIWKIFDNKALKRVQIKDTQLVSMTLSLLAFEAIIFIAWFVKSPPLPYVNFGDWTCNSPLGKNFELALSGYKILLIIANAFLAYSVRSVKLNQFNESLHIAFNIYFILTVFVLVTILELNMNKLRPTFIIGSFGTILIALCLLAVLFVPKLWVVAKERFPQLSGDQNNVRKRSIHESIALGSHNTGGSATKLVSGGMSHHDYLGDGSVSDSNSSSSALHQLGKKGNQQSSTGGLEKRSDTVSDNGFDWS